VGLVDATVAMFDTFSAAAFMVSSRFVVGVGFRCDYTPRAGVGVVVGAATGEAGAAGAVGWGAAGVGVGAAAEGAAGVGMGVAAGGAAVTGVVVATVPLMAAFCFVDDVGIARRGAPAPRYRLRSG
jgi:hypothetical protein